MLGQTRELLALTLVGKRTQTQTHLSYRRSHPSVPRFLVRHLAQMAVCRGKGTQSLIRSDLATDTQQWPRGNVSLH